MADFNFDETTVNRKPREFNPEEHGFSYAAEPEQKIPEPVVYPNPSGQINADQKITLTFDQLMQLMKSSNGAAQPAAPQQQYQPQYQQQPQQYQQQPQQPTTQNGNNPGTRVIYQSDDYEHESPNRKVFTSDEDDFLNSPEASRQVIRNIRQVSTRRAYTNPVTPNSGLNISEVEYESKNLPQLTDRYVTTQPVKAPRLINQEAGTPSVGYGQSQGFGQRYVPNSSKNPSGVNVEEYEFRESELGEKDVSPYSEWHILDDDIDEEEDPGKPEKPKKEKKQKAPKKKKNSMDTTRKVVLIIAIIAIIGSLGYLGYEYYLHKQNQEFEAEVTDLIVDVPTTEAPTTTKKSSSKSKKKEKETTTTEAVNTLEQQWATIRAEYPSVTFPTNLQLKYAKLYATNTDFVGYLEAEGTNLSLPVVQTTEEDAENSYLKKNFYGKATKYGCPYVSSKNQISTLDMNTVIFGHHMNDNTIFGALDVYKTIDGFKKAPVITFNTMYADYSWKIIAAFITNDSAEDDNNYKFEYTFQTLTQNSFATYLNELAKRSLYDTGVDVQATDKILTLSTCSHEFDNARFVVVARMVRPGETTDVDVSKASVNENPRYPQAWYDAKKKDNPYINDNLWYGDYIQ